MTRLLINNTNDFYRSQISRQSLQDMELFVNDSIKALKRDAVPLECSGVKRINLINKLTTEQNDLIDFYSKVFAPSGISLSVDRNDLVDYD